MPCSLSAAERALQDSFLADPDQAPTVEELCEIAFPSEAPYAKKHRVLAIKAAGGLCHRLPGWAKSRGAGLGGASVYFNRYSVRSYALMMLKTSTSYRYRSTDPRVLPRWNLDAAKARELIKPGGRYHHMLVDGGEWYRDVQRWIEERETERSGDQTLLPYSGA